MAIGLVTQSILMALLLPPPPLLDLPIQGPRGFCAGSDTPLYKKVNIDSPNYGFWCIKTISESVIEKKMKYVPKIIKNVISDYFWTLSRPLEAS